MAGNGGKKNAKSGRGVEFLRARRPTAPPTLYQQMNRII